MACRRQEGYPCVNKEIITMPRAGRALKYFCISHSDSERQAVVSLVLSLQRLEKMAIDPEQLPCYVCGCKIIVQQHLKN